MATDPTAKSIRGTDPQNLVEKILRTNIYQNNYWKQQCFGLTAETLVDKAMELDHVGGTRKPTPFMCLVTKMLQIQPEKEIVVEFIKKEDHKYVRVLGAFYLRLTGTDVDVYRYLEPLYNDNRKLRQRLADGKFAVTHMDVFIDELLTKDYSCDIVLPPIKKRWTLESLGSLQPRRSPIEDDFEEEEKDEDDQPGNGLDAKDREKDYYHGRSPTRERDRDRRRDSHNKYRHRDYEMDRGKRRDRDRERDRVLDRDRDRHHDREDKECGRERERDRRERDRDRQRCYSRSRSSSRGGKDNRHRRHASPSSRDEPKKKKKKEKKEKKDDGTNHLDPEISEANRLRACLGLKPLK